MKCFIPLLLAFVAAFSLHSNNRAQGDEKTETAKKFVIVIDSVSRYIFKANPDIELPTKNPRTGKLTITKALCCEQCAVCDRWKPVPVDVKPEEAPEKFLCPTHKTPLKSTGPIPNDLKFIEDLQQAK